MSPSTSILIVILLTLANGLFTMSELAIVSARKIRLQELAERGDVRARAALELARSPNRFLSTVQIGITLITILTSVFGEATLSQAVEGWIKLVPGLQLSEQALSTIGSGLVVLFITYLSLIIGELVPKRLALNNPEKIATAIALPMRMISRITAPIVHLLGISTDVILKLLGVRHAPETQLVTEEEIKIMMRQGTKAGLFEESEQDMIERVFSLGDEPVNALITPRLDVVWLDLNDAAEVNRRKMIESPQTQFPVCQDSLDNVLGVVYVKDVLARSLAGEPLDLTRLLRQPLFIAEGTRALKVLELFRREGTQVALVVNEYGVTQGLVTLNDVMEVIIGDIPEATDPDEPTAVQRDDGSWLVDGMLSIDEFKELFEIEELPDEERDNFQTLGGFVITHLGHIPRSTDHFFWDRFRFEVMDMDGNRVDKVLVVPGEEPLEPFPT